MHVQATPALIPHLSNITDISIGNQHILALSESGHLYSWGTNAQSQLGRGSRSSPRLGRSNLIPCRVGGPKSIKGVSTGGYHSFAITEQGRVWAWGLNQFGQCGIAPGKTVIHKPTRVKSLEKYNIVQIAAGEHHSAAITSDGDLLVWGRADYGRLGVSIDGLSIADIIMDDRGVRRGTHHPCIVSDIQVANPGDTQVFHGQKFSSITCGTAHNIAISNNGYAYSWGLSGSYQTGLGEEEDVSIPQLIQNTATENVYMLSAGAGGHFSVLGGQNRCGPVTL